MTSSFSAESTLASIADSETSTHAVDVNPSALLSLLFVVVAISSGDAAGAAIGQEEEEVMKTSSKDPSRDEKTVKETVLFNPSRGAEAKRADQRQRLANKSVRDLINRLCCFVLLLLLLDWLSWLGSGASVGSRLASLEEEEEQPLNPRRFKSLAYGQVGVPFAFCFILDRKSVV